jgi:hypothetical protein
VTKKKVYHQSEIKTYLMCGKRWEFEYVHGLRGLSSPEATIGSSADAAISMNLAQKVETKTDLPVEQLLDNCSADFEKRKLETAWDPEDDQGQSKDHAISIVKLFQSKVAPFIRPKRVQEKFLIETDGGFDLGGTIDYRDIDGWIGDLKTTSRQRASSFVVSRSFQPAMYDYAARAIDPVSPHVGFRFDIFTRPTKTLPAEYKPVSGVVTSQDHEWLFLSIAQVHSAIQAGIALPSPEGSWYCSAKWCPYWGSCKGKE